MKFIIIPNMPAMSGRHYCIAKTLVEQGHEVHYLIWALPYGMKPGALVKHLFTSLLSKTYRHEVFTVHTVRRLPYFWPYINGWLFKRQLCKLYRNLGADMIITETYTNETEVPEGLPFIYDLADDYAGPADAYGSRIYKLAFKLLDVRGVMRRQAKNAVAVTAVSQILYAFAKQYNDNTVKLPNGVEHDLIENVIADKKTRNRNKHAIVYASGFGQWSRVIETLEAVTKLRKEFPDIDLTLIGAGTESDSIQRYIKDHKAESYIHYLGYVYNRQELYSLINQAAIGLNISDMNKWRDASHPMKVMDYSALGKKIVSTDLAEVRALGYPNIYLFSDKNKRDSLISALRRALNDKKSYKDVSKAVLDAYSWQSLAKRLASLSEVARHTKRSPEIVHVAASYPPKLGGLEKVVRVLATTQAQSDASVAVITSDQDAYSELPEDSFPVHRLKSFVVANTTIIPTLLFKLLRTPRNAMVHLHITQAYTPEMVWLAAKLKGFKYVAHIHLDVPPSGRVGFLLKVYKPLLLRHVLRSAQSVIVFTKDQKVEISHKYGIASERIEVIPNGVEDKFFTDKVRAVHKKPRLLFVGRLNYQKNLDQLLHALEGVSNKFITTIVGDGELGNELKATAQELKLKNVTFAGRADGQKLLDYYHEADVFVLPSEREGMPLALLEAMAAGLPIVATKVTGSRDVVKHGKNGLLVPYGDHKALQAALFKATTNKQAYRAMSLKARETAAELTWQKVATRISGLYQRARAGRTSERTPAITTRSLKPWQLYLPLLVLANVTYFFNNIIGWIITLSFFLLVPGYLLLSRITGDIKERWEAVSLSLGLSLFVLMVGGLFLNSLHVVGLAIPFTTFNIFAMLDLATLLLIVLNHDKRMVLPKLTALPSKEQLTVIVLLTLLPLFAIGGAIRLNNGASNVLTMIMIAAIALFFIAVFSRKSLIPLHEYALLMFAMSILFSTSLRGWYITGHDIQHEFEVFQATAQNGLWQALTLHRDPYSACLSITILPTILAKITSIPAAYIFKFVFQVVAAFVVVPIYLLAKKLSSERVALISALIFISFPPFLNDMPFLNRQEIAFIFFALLLLVSFMKLAYKPKFVLTALILVGLVLSHYSTSYVTLGIIGGSWVAYKLLTLKRADIQPFSLPLLSLPLIVGALLLTFTWNSLITQTSPGLRQTFNKAVHDIETHSFAQANGVNYSLFSFNTPDPQKILDTYAGSKAGQAKYVPDANLSVTPLGRVVNHIISVQTLNKLVRLISAKLLQVLLLIGLVITFLRIRKSRSQKDTYFFALTVACTALLVALVILPQLSVAYSVTRFFQQELMIISIPIILAAQLLAKPTGKYRDYVVAGFFVFLFLHLSGFIPQALGGYPPQLALNNAGTYYDIYYMHASERDAAAWLTNEAGGKQVVADEYARMRFLNYPFQSLFVTDPLETTATNGYLYLDYTNTTRGLFAGFLSGDVIEYRYNSSLARGNLVYSDSTAQVYGPRITQ